MEGVVAHHTVLIVSDVSILLDPGNDSEPKTVFGRVTIRLWSQHDPTNTSAYTSRSFIRELTNHRLDSRASG